MNKPKFKIVILTHGGAERLIELLSQLADVEIAGVYVETVTERPRPMFEKLKRSVRYDGYAATLRKIASIFNRSRKSNNNESQMMARGRSNLLSFARELNIPVFEVEDYHAEEAQRHLRAANADLGVIYGTNNIKETVFSIPTLGSINLHQGLAPYYRGGPPVFWELFNDEKEIGITVHFVAAKVDSGDIVLQSTVPLHYDYAKYGINYNQFLTDFRKGLAEPSAQLVAEAVRRIADNSYERRKQDTNLGRRYRLPIKSEKDQLLRLLTQRSHQ